MIRVLGLSLLLMQQAWANHHEPGHPSPGDSGGVNASHQRDKPYLVLISIDGYRWDYPELYPTPAISRLISEGRRAERLVPAWPTLTFPNHYTIVTGLHPADHGLVSNDFPDPLNDRWYRLRDRLAVQDGSFYGGEPIWVTAESQGLVAASFFWVGSEADVKGVRPTYWRFFDKKVDGEDRVGQVLSWLAEPPANRPHLITLYFEMVDDQAHWRGPGSEEFLAALSRVDTWLTHLMEGIEKLPHGDRVNLVLVSDHGHLTYHEAEPFVLDTHIDISSLSVIDGGAYVFAWQKQPDAGAAQSLAWTVNEAWGHGHAFTAATAPPAWRIRDNDRMPHLVFQADPGYAVISSPSMASKVTASDHGWAPETPEMHGIMIARGSEVGQDWPVGALNASDVHPLLLRMLGLQATAPHAPKGSILP